MTPAPRLGLLAAACTCAWLLVHGCGPGPGYGGRSRPRRLTPLAYKQHVPNVSENNLGASGRAEGKITRRSERFNELVCNYNTDIDFKDEERTKADRFMTKRCKDCLNKLAIAVMNQWPGVRLRVTEAWDEDDNHPSGSLHYEGRAVDITTSDRDIKKYGLLAQLAVEAGFDWVYYESKYHVHCSVKADHSVAVEKGGCFSGSALVTVADGVQKPMSRLHPGDSVLALSESGGLIFSRVLLFLHLDTQHRSTFLILSTENGQRLTITPNHLIFTAPDLKLHYNEYYASFANKVRKGAYVLICGRDGRVHPSKIASVSQDERTGVYAPLTERGNLFVDGVLVSSYASIEDQRLAHWAFGPLRFLDGLSEVFMATNPLSMMTQRCAEVHKVLPNHQLLFRGHTNVMSNSSGAVRNATNEMNSTRFKEHRRLDCTQEGVHWYAKLLCVIAQIFWKPHLMTEGPGQDIPMASFC